MKHEPRCGHKLICCQNVIGERVVQLKWDGEIGLGRERGGANWEIGADVYVLLTLGVTQMTNESLPGHSGSLAGCSVVTKIGRESRTEGTYVYRELIHFAYSRNPYSSAKQLYSNKN